MILPRPLLDLELEARLRAAANGHVAGRAPEARRRFGLPALLGTLVLLAGKLAGFRR